MYVGLWRQGFSQQVLALVSPTQIFLHLSLSHRSSCTFLSLTDFLAPSFNHAVSLTLLKPVIDLYCYTLIILLGCYNFWCFFQMVPQLFLCYVSFCPALAHSVLSVNKYEKGSHDYILFLRSFWAVSSTLKYQYHVRWFTKANRFLTVETVERNN